MPVITQIVTVTLSETETLLLKRIVLLYVLITDYTRHYGSFFSI